MTDFAADSSPRYSSSRSFNNGLSPLDLLSARGRHLAERIGLGERSSLTTTSNSSNGSSRRLSDISISTDDIWDRRMSMLSTDSDISSILHADAFMTEKDEFNCDNVVKLSPMPPVPGLVCSSSSPPPPQARDENHGVGARREPPCALNLQHHNHPQDYNEYEYQDQTTPRVLTIPNSPIKAVTPRGSSLAVTASSSPRLIPNFSRPSSYISTTTTPGLTPPSPNLGMEKLSVCESNESYQIRGRRQVSSNARLQSGNIVGQQGNAISQRSRSASPTSKRYYFPNQQHMYPNNINKQHQQQQHHSTRNTRGQLSANKRYHRPGSSLQIPPNKNMTTNIPTSQAVLEATLYDGLEGRAHPHQYPCSTPRQISFLPKQQQQRTSIDKQQQVIVSPSMPPVAFSVPAIKRRAMDEKSGQELLSKGISLHEEDDLAGSTYYFQCAAQMGEPAGMILYGLALRHGWGVGANPKHGIMWLDKAIRVLLGGVDKSNNNNKSINLLSVGDLDEIVERAIKIDMPKDKKVKVGLALYELGVSYVHSFGVDKDEKTGLVCFELAASLGDCDALCEAAGLYMRNGNGWKRDMNRSAKYYRLAAERGVRMVGNTWIYKDKYMDNSSDKHKRGGWFH